MSDAEEKKQNLAAVSVVALVSLYRLLANFKHTVLTAVFGYSSRCKHEPPCSQYTLYHVRKDGTIRGLWRGLKRTLTCW